MEQSERDRIRHGYVRDADPQDDTEFTLMSEADYRQRKFFWSLFGIWLVLLLSGIAYTLQVEGCFRPAEAYFNAQTDSLEVFEHHSEIIDTVNLKYETNAYTEDSSAAAAADRQTSH